MQSTDVNANPFTTNILSIKKPTHLKRNHPKNNKQVCDQSNGSPALVMFVQENASDITMQYCLLYLPWQLGSFLFGLCCPRWPMQAQ
jgi:hypothetical protein